MQVILITGATSGIGYAIVDCAMKAGYTVIMNGRDSEKLRVCQEQFEIKYNRKVYCLNYDVSSYESIKDAFLWIKKEFGKLDVLVNNAGVMEDSLLGMIRQEQLLNTMDTNANAVIYHMQYASRLMIKQKTGSIINISSIIGRNGNAGQVVYSASKAAVIGATYSAAKELAPYNIRVNAVAPGFIETDLVSVYSEQQKQETISQIKMGRAGKPEEVANVVMFLASDLSSYVTGQVIGVDGGMIV